MHRKKGGRGVARGMSQSSAGCGCKEFTNLAGKIGMHILFYTNKIMLHKLEKIKFEPTNILVGMVEW